LEDSDLTTGSCRMRDSSRIKNVISRLSKISNSLVLVTWKILSGVEGLDGYRGGVAAL
jgi:hypothetical protein